MAIQLGSAYGKIVIDSSGVSVGVGGAVKSLGTLQTVAAQVGSSLSSVGRSMTLGLTLPIIALGGAAIKAASDYEEAKNKALVVFGEMSDGVVSNADKAATALGINKKAYLDYASSVGAALTAGGMSLNEATSLSEQAVKHFSDLMSFHNTSIEDAAMAWQSAIRGQFEPIQKYFPFITDSFLKTYGTANGMLDANTKTLTANQRAIILNAIALDEKLNPALNDFSETSNSLANTMKITQADVFNALIALGTNLIPITYQIVSALNKMLEAFNNMSPGQQKAVLGFMAFLAVLGPLLSILGSVISLIAGISTIAGSLGISFTAVAGAAGAAGTALVGVGASAVLLLGQILLLAAGPVLLYLAFKNNFMGITTTIKQLWEIIKFYFGQIVKRITDAFKSINWGAIGRAMLVGLANGMLGGLPMIIMAASRIATAALNAIKAKLGINSPSLEFLKLGKFSGQGFQMGLANAMDPNTIARTMAKPVQNMSSQNAVSNTFHLSNGLTLRDVDAMMNEKINRFAGRLDKAMS